jgi:hypothetical protein
MALVGVPQLSMWCASAAVLYCCILVRCDQLLSYLEVIGCHGAELLHCRLHHLQQTCEQNITETAAAVGQWHCSLCTDAAGLTAVAQYGIVHCIVIPIALVCSLLHRLVSYAAVSAADIASCLLCTLLYAALLCATSCWRRQALVLTCLLQQMLHHIKKQRRNRSSVAVAAAVAHLKVLSSCAVLRFRHYSCSCGYS